MLDIKNLREVSVDHIRPVESPTNPRESVQFSRGQDLALLLYTEAGTQLVNDARQIVRTVLEQIYPAPKGNFAAAEDSQWLTSIEGERVKSAQETWQEEIETKVKLSMVGDSIWSNVCDDVFTEIKHSDWRPGLSRTEDQKIEIDSLHVFFQAYGMAVDYQARQGTDDNLRLPGLEPGKKSLIMDHTNIDKVRDAFKQGWNSISS